jgi:hypothetical protein
MEKDHGLHLGKQVIGHFVMVFANRNLKEYQSGH